ncbi:MAG: Gfo/Idh/MocA family oxidoreductase [Kiritimatiellae bacterium]|nr:Gfo/Idh/MocA family oxidoreductase [Kiritimatiellia bacterium]
MRANISRRQALKLSALGGAAFSILPASLHGDNAPSQRVNIAMIGTGRQGINANMRTFLGMENVRVVSVCDVDQLRLNYAKSLVDKAYGNSDCKTFGDFREALDMPGLDAVMISTPDHWHTIPALMAMKKGLHVCCEKAMTRYFDEGRALADMAKKSGVVFRLDSECRSYGYMVKTANLVMNGYIGNIKRIEVGVPHEFGKKNPDASPTAPPVTLNYEMWQGPAPMRPYVRDRVHYTDIKSGKPVQRPGWLKISDYCAGMICNWGGHLLDVANMINGTSHSGPISVEGSGKFPESGLFDTIIDFELQYMYANGVKLDYRIKSPYVRIEGDDGWILSNWFKGGLKAHDQKIFRTEFRPTDKLVSTESDKQDFINAIIKGDPVMIDAETGHRINSQCLLGLAAVRTGKRIEWDPVQEVVTNSDEAEKLLKFSSYRTPWELKKFV